MWFTKLATEFWIQLAEIPPDIVGFTIIRHYTIAWVYGYRRILPYWSGAVTAKKIQRMFTNSHNCTLAYYHSDLYAPKMYCNCKQQIYAIDWMHDACANTNVYVAYILINKSIIFISKIFVYLVGHSFIFCRLMLVCFL